MKTLLMKIFNIFRRKPKQQQIAAPATVNFTQDTECLFALIKTFVENERFKVQIAQKKILSDSELIDIANEITIRTVSTLSEPYKAVLWKYISEEELVPFISEIVVRGVVQFGMDINRKTV